MKMIKSHLMSPGSLSSSILGVLPQLEDSLKNVDKTDIDLMVGRVGAAAVVLQVTRTNWPMPAYSILVTGEKHGRQKNKYIKIII